MDPLRRKWLDLAIAEAEAGLAEGGLLIGSVLVHRATGQVISSGHNLRVQTNDPTAHAEVVAIRNAGRRNDWHNLVLVSTLSPCIMCTGTALLLKIPEVIAGENVNFSSFAEQLIRDRGVKVELVQDQKCIKMMGDFIASNPALWNEDIHDINEKSRS